MGYVHKFPENKILFVLCDCHSEILAIEYDPEIKMAELAIYENGVSFRNKMTFWQKCRYVYQVLFHNKPFGDQIIINQKQIKDIKKFLSEIN